MADPGKITGIYAHAEISPGRHIGSAAEWAVKEARRLGITVVFKFNGRTMKATPNSQADVVEAEYLAWCNAAPTLT